MDLSTMSTAQLEALYNQGVAQQRSGFTGAPGAEGGAPDKIAARQRYSRDAAELSKDREALKSVAPNLAQLDTFEKINQQQGTGSLLQQIPGVSSFFNGPNPDMRSMENMGASMGVHNVPPGQGAVSNYERSLYAAGQPSVKNTGGVNSNIINHMRATTQAEQDRLSFLDAYIAQHGHLGGASEAWTRYTQTNPYEITAPVTKEQVDKYGYPKAGKVVVNPKRTGWQDYFGIQAPAAQQRPAQVPQQPFRAKNGFLVQE